MKKKAKLNPIEKYAPQIVREINQWNYILEHGCSDPFWPDGANMNLIRNHIISYKREIAECCEATGTELPFEYYLPTYTARGRRKLYDCEKRRKSGSD